MSTASPKPRFKLHGGHLVAAAFGLFVAYILYFVWQSMQHEIDLVSEDYYAREVAYQDRIEAKENVARWPGEITVEMTSAGIRIELGEEAGKGQAKGRVTVFRPSDAALDIQRPLQLDATGKMILPRELFAKGRYDVQLEWKDSERAYYFSQHVFVP